MSHRSPQPEQWRLRRPYPALWRGQGVLQVGTDPLEALVLEGVPDEIESAVALLAEPRTKATLRRLVPALAPIWVDWLLDQLQAAGLLIVDEVPLSSVTVVGTGSLAEAVVGALGEAGVDRPARFASGPWADPGARQRTQPPGIRHWAQAAEPWGEITVVATNTAEPDRALTDELLRTNRTHLVVRLEADAAIVGPLVVPGRSACVRCVDLARCGLDPEWPRLLAQLCLARTPPQAALRSWAAWLATVQVRALQRGSWPESVGRTLELATSDYVLRVRTWPASPGCGCLAQVA